MLDTLKSTNKIQLKQLITNLFYGNSIKFKQAQSNQASQYVMNLMNTKTTQPSSAPASPQINNDVSDDAETETDNDATIEEQTYSNNEPDKSTSRLARQKKRVQADQSNYKDIFLTERNLKDRQSVYISKKLHLKLSNYLSVIGGKGFSIGVFIDNILNEHLSNYKAVLDELYRSETEKLLNQ